MTFPRQWEERFRVMGNISVWPWSDLVSYVRRYAKPISEFRRVLELGCGAGANIPFFLSLGLDYSTIEGSETVVAMVCEAYPELRDKIAIGDFTRELPFDGLFDLVVDRCSTPHNTTEAMEHTISMVFDRLRPGGKFIGIDWLSDSHQDARRGQPLDSHTRTDIPAGQFANIGPVHFSDENHIVRLLSMPGFHLDRLEHKRLDTVLPKEGGNIGTWNFVATKP